MITIVLSLVLLALIGGYIYFGMYLAKRGDVQPVVQPEATTTTERPGTAMTREQKMEILKSLSDSAATATPTTVEERQKILNSLSSQSNDASATPKMSEDQKLKILESLKNN